MDRIIVYAVAGSPGGVSMPFQQALGRGPFDPLQPDAPDPSAILLRSDDDQRLFATPPARTSVGHDSAR